MRIGGPNLRVRVLSLIPIRSKLIRVHRLREIRNLIFVYLCELLLVLRGSGESSSLYQDFYCLLQATSSVWADDTLDHVVLVRT